MIHKTTTVSTLAITLALILTPMATFAADKKIDVYVDSGKLKFSNSECPSDQNMKGCIKTGKGVKNKLKWELDSGDRNSWALVKLTLLKGSLSAADWACAVSDFNLDPQTGVSGGFNQKSWGGEVNNGNNCANAYEVNYELEANPSGGGAPINSDPVIRNGGKGDS